MTTLTERLRARLANLENAWSDEPGENGAWMEADEIRPLHEKMLAVVEAAEAAHFGCSGLACWTCKALASLGEE